MDDHFQILKASLPRYLIIVIGVILLLMLVACSGKTVSLTPTSATATASPFLDSPAETAPPREATRTPLPLPTPTVLPATLTAEPLDLPVPLPGWAIYESKLAEYALVYPVNWVQKPNASQNQGLILQSPETFSQIFVEIRPYTTELESNATWRGLPAQLSLEEGGGSAQITLTIVGDRRTISLRFHSGVLPRLEAEMLVFRQIIDSLIFEGTSNEASHIPFGWEQGSSLVRWLPALVSVTEPPELQEILATVINIDPFDFQVMVDDGQQVQLYFSSGYQFQGLPLRFASLSGESIVVDDHIRVIGYWLASGSFKPEYAAVERDGVWQPHFIKSFFDLTWEGFDLTLLARYPQDEPVNLWLRGTFEQVQPLLVDVEGNVFAESDFSVEQSQEVLVQGTLQMRDSYPQLVLKELYALNGKCVLVSEMEEQCLYWQPAYPPATPTTITATVLEADEPSRVVVLAEPVQGFVTIKLEDEGQLLSETGTLLAWDDLVTGTQLQATGTSGRAGALHVHEWLISSQMN